MEDIICAISTPIGRGAISIVRMSGQGCLKKAEELFSSSSLDYKNILPRMMYLGYFNFKDGGKEHCFMVYFKAPKSYTGEDLIEFSIHGGTLLAQKVVESLLGLGVRLADAGEFSKRAFENGKISLDQAENIIAEINAQSEGELKASLMLAEGKLSGQIKELQEFLTENIAQIEATLDYPEEDFEKSAKDKIFNDLKIVEEKIENFIKSSQNARYLTKGINVAIVGSPNVGKSSLLNALVGQDRAIVTDVEGTTRDVLTESISYKGINLNFIDTAGIRQAKDIVERLGIEKSKQSLQKADVILFVLDGSRELSSEDKEIKSLLKNYKNVVTIVNKSDKKRVLVKEKDEIESSAQNGKNIEKIKEKIYNFVIKEEIDYNKIIVINERQCEILKNCEKIIEQILQSKESSMDIIAMLIKKLWNELGKITGQCENEQIIDLIFSKFCLGK